VIHFAGGNIMKNLQINYPGGALNFQGASILAKQIAKENDVREPTIISWHTQSDQHMSSYYDGANPDSWWKKYGEGNGGKLEVDVGDEYQFVMMDAQGYETLGDMPLRNLSDSSGNQYLCYTPLLGKASRTPTPEACTYLDEWTADQF
jgi:hypothetical protein